MSMSLGSRGRCCGQVRVRNDSCTVHPTFSKYRLSCYGPYAADNEHTDSYGVGQIKYDQRPVLRPPASSLCTA